MVGILFEFNRTDYHAAGKTRSQENAITLEFSDVGR